MSAIKDAQPGECWAARDEDGTVCLFYGHPEKFDKSPVGGHWDTSGQLVNLGHISFRPELPWNETACKVRVRLEVVE